MTERQARHLLEGDAVHWQPDGSLGIVTHAARRYTPCVTIQWADGTTTYLDVHDCEHLEASGLLLDQGHANRTA